MKPEGSAKHFIFAFLLALAGYVIIYQSIEHRRTRDGPWQVTFTTRTGKPPSILIDQPRLGITNVVIMFNGEALGSMSAPRTLRFDPPKPVPYEVPFGKCVFLDTTFLPGTVTLLLFGHEIELLPRVLLVDRQEHRWQSDSTFTVPLEKTTPIQAKP